MKIKAANPPGTQDRFGKDIYQRDYVVNVIKSHFVRFGFLPLETPSYETNDTLLGKYGEEGDKLIFRILNSGDFMQKVPDEIYKAKQSRALAGTLTEKSLRYDLTIPFARYVVQHRNDISLPFKRFQIQPVWRADRPQKGRYREFFQCDADIVGPRSFFQELDLIKLYDQVFAELQLPTTVRINHRAILQEWATEIVGVDTEAFLPFLQTLDKLDKVGKQGVLDILTKYDYSPNQLEAVSSALDQGANLDYWVETLSAENQGVKELQSILRYIQQNPLKHIELAFDFSLIRGLDYYNGCVFEVLPQGMSIGSIGGGGRYDNLTQLFGWEGLSGVGISFGLDRILLCMKELDLFPPSIDADSKLDYLFLNFSTQESLQALPYIDYLRTQGHKVDMYPTADKFKKQMNYANKIETKHVVFYGEKEIAAQKLVIKNMATGEQHDLPIDTLR